MRKTSLLGVEEGGIWTGVGRKGVMLRCSLLGKGGLGILEALLSVVLAREEVRKRRSFSLVKNVEQLPAS
jgi:hypothetical protein